METKTCGRCSDDKSIDSFYRKGRGYQSWCKDCANVNARQHYKDNQREKIAYTKRQKRNQVIANQQLIVDYLSSHPCVDCNEDDIVVLEFDHNGDKLNNVSSMSRNSTQRVLEEIAKCDVRCANCHRKKTAIEQQNYRLFIKPR